MTALDAPLSRPAKVRPSGAKARKNGAKARLYLP